LYLFFIIDGRLQLALAHLETPQLLGQGLDPGRAGSVRDGS
jgi:hypothetical protein